MNTECQHCGHENPLHYRFCLGCGQELRREQDLSSAVSLPVAEAVVPLQRPRVIKSSFWNLAKAARVEIRKVVWPTRQETTQTTLIVLGVVLLMALILWGLDSLLGWIVSSVIG